MKAKVDNVLRYIIKKYSNNYELTKTRITKLVYLVDWESALMTDKQLTDIKWYFDHYGPYVSDVFDTADEDSELTIVEKVSNFGTKKYIVEAKFDKDNLIIDLDENEKSIIDRVIEETKNMNWNDFIDYVYSTYPIEISEKYGILNLVELAKKFKKTKTVKT
ncbi:Panacea domain-containing protein [Streptococcus infantis]|uniref:Panacea domain-containing protein n=1 Tax=Streptococcus infantis TaxID=68892 RepID=UPI0039C1A1F2